MKSYRVAISLNLLFVAAFVLFIISYEVSSTAQKQQNVNVHAKVVSSSVWTLFTEVTEQYLSLSAKNNDYQQMRISSLGDLELFSYTNELNGLDALLYDMGLIRTEPFNAEIFYKDRHIGSLEVSAYNKNIYLYCYIFIVLLLTCLLIWFICIIYAERKNLQFRVDEKIAELADYNLQLQDEIAERKRSEKALRESEQTFHALFDNSFQFIALLDPEGRVRECNKTSLDAQRLKESDVVGKYFWDTLWWSHHESLVKKLKSACISARKGNIARFEAHFTATQEAYIDITLKPVFNDDQQLIHLLAEGRDVTNIRRAELELQQAQKMESVGTLAGGIAHDFNNILGGILGTLALLKLKRDKGQQLPEEKLFNYLDTITETALRAKDMVTQLLTLSRKYDLKFAPVNLQQVLQNVCQIASTSFDKSITFDVQIADQIPVTADANSLEQVFLNICINAAHAMTIMRPPGEAWGGTLGIHLMEVAEKGQIGREAGNYWQITISDTGVGMDSSSLEQIYVPFFTTKTKDAGSGLGLSMVYNIIKQHHGFIDVESEKGVGSSFHICLPINDEVRADYPAKQDPPALVEGEGLILIIDDEALIRNSAAEMLEECGYQVLQAENGQVGIELYKQRQAEINAVLLDLVMPVMSGKETYVTLKKINPQVKVLLSSGFRHDARVDEILDAGVLRFIQKPYSLHALSSAIKEALT